MKLKLGEETFDGYALCYTGTYFMLLSIVSK